jgi:hypothetical protein
MTPHATTTDGGMDAAHRLQSDFTQPGTSGGHDARRGLHRLPDSAVVSLHGGGLSYVPWRSGGCRWLSGRLVAKGAQVQRVFANDRLRAFQKIAQKIAAMFITSVDIRRLSVQD